MMDKAAVRAKSQHCFEGCESMNGGREDPNAHTEAMTLGITMLVAIYNDEDWEPSNTVISSLS